MRYLACSIESLMAAMIQVTEYRSRSVTTPT